MSKKTPRISRSPRASQSPLSSDAAQVAVAEPATAMPTAARRTRWRAAIARRERWWWAGALLLLAGPVFVLWTAPRPAPLNVEAIDKMMRASIAEKPLPSAVARAYAVIQPSVVRVVGLSSADDDSSDANSGVPTERGVGTGVIIMDNGTILTNLHVVQGAKRIKVTFSDGLESDAVVVNVQPENDLAVLRARKIPDDLVPATMRSTADLAPGDAVLAVGFPFGIGPSASSGVVSGLKREFRSPEGEQLMSNLIQFDAAANPGNSGGPLVTMEGQVVGIVTAILNPSDQRVFIGIGFAVPIESAAGAVGLSPF